MKKTIPILLLAISIIILYTVSLKNKGVSVNTIKVTKNPLLITVTAISTGTVKAETEARISAQRTGRIERLFFDEGSIVEKGRVIAELDREEAFLNLKLAETALQKAQLRLDEMRISLNVLKTDVETNISKTKAILIEADKRLKRSKDLFKHGYITEVELDATEREYSIAKVSHESALAAKKKIEAQIYDIKLQEAVVKEAEHALSLAKLNYDYSFIRSPITGVITSKNVKLGETVMKGTVIGSVVSVDSLYIEAFIDEADIAAVSVGQAVNITMDAYPDRVFKGEVYRISPVVTGGKQETRTFEVRTKLKELPPTIKPGMSAEIEIIVNKLDNVISVPTQAIIKKDGKSFLYVVKNSRAKIVPVTTGFFNWTYTEIVSGLNEGDEVIITPNVHGLYDGVKITKN